MERFPSGSFAFSCGIEGVVALRPELDQAVLAELTATIICQRWPAAPTRARIAMRLLAPDGGTLVRGIEAAFHVASRSAPGAELAPRRK
jgi:hypothetical protein